VPPDAVARATANAEVTVLAAHPSPPPEALGTTITSKLATRGMVLGLVAVGAERANAFAPEEVQLLRILCNQASVALENSRLFQQAQFLATRDGLTGLLNHRSFYQRLEEEIARSKRHNVPLSLVLLDTDCLKRMNDQYGHLTGDELLRVFSRLIASSVRRGDVVARYGGDEFAMLLPHTTPEAAMALCERLRRRVETHEFVAGEQVEQIGASFGVAGFDPLLDPDDGAEFVRRADEALYRAKSAGRNRIEVAERSGVRSDWSA
jgi:two-component system cell cycle response regulator